MAIKRGVIYWLARSWAMNCSHGMSWTNTKLMNREMKIPKREAPILASTPYAIYFLVNSSLPNLRTKRRIAAELQRYKMDATMAISRNEVHNWRESKVPPCVTDISWESRKTTWPMANALKSSLMTSFIPVHVQFDDTRSTRPSHLHGGIGASCIYR